MKLVRMSKWRLQLKLSLNCGIFCSNWCNFGQIMEFFRVQNFEGCQNCGVLSRKCGVFLGFLVWRDFWRDSAKQWRFSQTFGNTGYSLYQTKSYSLYQTKKLLSVLHKKSTMGEKRAAQQLLCEQFNKRKPTQFFCFVFHIGQL